MMIQKPPKEVLVDEIVYREYLGEGDYNKPIYGKYETIKHVRIDRKPQFTFGSQGKQLLYSATVFCYFGLTTPLPEFKAQDVVIFDGVEHSIISPVFFKEPYIDQVYSYELGVI